MKKVLTNARKLKIAETTNADLHPIWAPSAPSPADAVRPSEYATP